VTHAFVYHNIGNLNHNFHVQVSSLKMKTLSYCVNTIKWWVFCFDHCKCIHLLCFNQC